MSQPADEIRQDTMEQVRTALITAAMAAYEQAGISGLCAEGRWECVLGALRRVDLSQLAACRT